MLTFLAFAMIAVFMALIVTKRMSVSTALILVPIAFALIAGFRGEMGAMMLDGVKALAPTAVMLLFAILFFSIMIDVGLFEPIVRRVVRIVKGDPLRILIGTSMLTLFVSLDGDGSTTYRVDDCAARGTRRRRRCSASRSRSFSPTTRSTSACADPESDGGDVRDLGGRDGAGIGDRAGGSGCSPA